MGSLATGGDTAPTEGATCDAASARARGAVPAGDCGARGPGAEVRAEVAPAGCPVRAVAAAGGGWSRAGSAPGGLPGVAPVRAPPGFFPRGPDPRASPARAQAGRTERGGAVRPTGSGLWPAGGPGAGKVGLYRQPPGNGVWRPWCARLRASAPS